MVIAANKKGCWLLYMVKCRDGSLYTGVTNDIGRRLAMHNAGTASRYTRSRLPVELVYQEGCRSKSSALQKEYRVKELTRKEKEEFISRKLSARRRRKTK